MAMGKRKPRQESLFITTDQLMPSAGHPFYQRLNALLAENGFDDWIERRGAEFYAREEPRGRPSVPPGVYFRMLLVGYFEGLDSQRGIAWRCSDSLSLRAFLGISLDRATPDHSTLTNTRKRLPEEVFDEVFRFVLGIAEANELIAGTTVGVGSTLLEANAAMKSIVRRDTGENGKQYVTKLMREAGAIGPGEEPSHEAARRFDKKRKGKKVSNEEWKSSTDAGARIAHMKDGTTHLAYKAEHVVDLESDLVLAAEIRLAADGDAATMAESLLAAQENLEQCGCAAVIGEVAADKGYHAAPTLETCADFGWRTYLPEPRRQHPIKLSNRSEAQRRAVLNNRSRTSRSKSKRLQRRRSEVVERTFAHVCETGGGRRSHVRGLVNATKWYLLAVAAHDLGRILRTSTGIGKPRSLQGAGGSFLRRGRQLWSRSAGRGAMVVGLIPQIRVQAHPPRRLISSREKEITSTGC